MRRSPTGMAIFRTANREDLADVQAGRPIRKRPRLPDRQDVRILLQALELHIWIIADASCKLMRLQVQPNNTPLPAAYHSGDDAYAVAAWILNPIPGTNAQCRGCNDKSLSRYHITARCIDSMNPHAQTDHRLAYTCPARQPSGHRRRHRLRGHPA